jgi:hypothetical protein
MAKPLFVVIHNNQLRTTKAQNQNIAKDTSMQQNHKFVAKFNIITKFVYLQPIYCYNLILHSYDYKNFGSTCSTRPTHSNK